VPEDELDLRSAEHVSRAFCAGAEACRSAACRRGSIEVIEPPGRLIATGDLHDNPIHLDRLIRVAHLDEPDAAIHLTLHEIIHSDRLLNGMDLSYRALARVAHLKANHPERVHVLLANHELAQVTGAGIVKDGVRVVEAFNAGVEYAFGSETDAVLAAIDEFVRAMPLALRCVCPGGDVLCAHSLPPPWLMSRFDPGVLERDLCDEDYEPRRGSAHLMVWGRGYDADLIEDLVLRWGVRLFILGHERAETGATFVPPCAVVLNSDHERGVYLPLDLSSPPAPTDVLSAVKPLTEESGRERGRG